MSGERVRLRAVCFRRVPHSLGEVARCADSGAWYMRAPRIGESGRTRWVPWTNIVSPRVNPNSGRNLIITIDKHTITTGK